jgi:mTERF domain-containing protein
MFHYHRLRAILNPQIPKCYLLHPTHFLKPFSTTTTSDSDQLSFTVSYLTNTCGLSPNKALKASKLIRFNTPNKPDSVIAFFKTHGFSNDQIQSIIHRAPVLLNFDPIKTILPKFQFLSSKGASPSEIVDTVTRAPNFLRASLEKQLIPAFELVRSFCPSNQKAINSIIACPTSISDIRMKPNIQLLLDFGATPASIYRLLTTRPSIICSSDWRKVLEEIKELGFDPSSYKFCMALLAKRAITKSQWDAKVGALKSWGCSEDEIFNAFKKQPNIMLRSPDKLNAVMRFWIKQFGWDPLLLMSAPGLFGFSIEKRLIPRASVVQYLLSKGLLKKDASLVTPFYLTDELFRQRYVNRFKEEAYRLLKLYQGEDSSIRCLDKLNA